MLLVVGDDLRRRRFSIATFVIGLICVSASAVAIASPNVFAFIVRTFAFVPLEFSLHPAASAYRLVTAEFVHLGSLHLLGNLVFLFAFGRSIENLVGPTKYAAALVGLGALSFLGSWLLDPVSARPIVGISGGLSFLVGAYTVIFPRARLRIIPFLRVPYFRAWLFAVLWTALQLWGVAFVGENVSAVAYATHLAGLVLGMVAGVVWKEFSLDTDRLISELVDEAKP
jgi:membrane associated rhomboid family serine protease